jgi:ubiquinone/menaquinone biosynthesis C-methylase UbiE
MPPMSDARVSHPVFARFFDRLSALMEREVGAHRDRLLAGLSGRVIEVGAGNGVNFAHYPDTVSEVVALEPEAYLRRKAEKAGSRAPVPVRVVDATADELPFDPASFDAAVASLVLCTIPDVPGALAELRRVLRPGAELRFFEHVRSDQSAKARVQQVFDRTGVWPWVGGGCHCSRRTVSTIEAAGYTVGDVASMNLGPSWGITNPHVLGVARVPVPVHDPGRPHDPGGAGGPGGAGDPGGAHASA